jgi:phosphoglycerate kinase
MQALNKKSIDDLNLENKKVLMRCDFNVPIQENKITDDTRIKAALPSIKKLISSRAKIILCSHLGKPKGFDAKFSLRLVANRLSELLNQEIIFIEDSLVSGEETRARIKELRAQEIILLENTRFRLEETKDLDSFSQELADLCDREIYINDAFGSSHRAHCSTHGVTKFVSESAVGYLMQKEINFLGNALNTPKRPFVAILGGAKVSDKIGVIENLLTKVDKLIIGGGMAYTFFKAQGFEIGKSLCEEDKIDYARELINKARANNIELLLPIDNIITQEFSESAEFKLVKSNQIQKDYMGMDIGEETRELFKQAIKDAKTVIWNGPMGVFEFDNFSKGTFAIAQALADLKSDPEAITIIGGGDSASAINKAGLSSQITHISTGGGASLEFLEGKDLPGVSAIQDKN